MSQSELKEEQDYVNLKADFQNHLEISMTLCEHKNGFYHYLRNAIFFKELSPCAAIFPPPPNCVPQDTLSHSATVSISLYAYFVVFGLVYQR